MRRQRQPHAAAILRRCVPGQQHRQRRHELCPGRPNAWHRPRAIKSVIEALATMRLLPENPLASALDVSPLRPEPPAWVGHLFADPHATVQETAASAPLVTSCRNGTFTLVSGAADEPSE